MANVVASPRSDRPLSEFEVVQGPRRVRVPKGKAKAREGERGRRVFEGDDTQAEAGGKVVL